MWLKYGRILGNTKKISGSLLISKKITKTWGRIYLKISATGKTHESVLTKALCCAQLSVGAYLKEQFAFGTLTRSYSLFQKRPKHKT